MKKLLISSLIALAAPVLPVSAAGAASSADWVKVEIPCATGGKAAVIGYSPTHPWWMPESDEDGAGLRNPDGWRSWYKNPCKGQWLVFGVWGGDPSEGSTTYWSVGTGKSGRVGGPTSARLQDAPICFADTSGTVIVAKAKDNPC